MAIERLPYTFGLFSAKRESCQIRQKNSHTPEHIGGTIDGLEITPSLIVVGSHLLGSGKMRDWLDGMRELTPGQTLLGLGGARQLPTPFLMQ